jgi:hypothetical protein
VTSTEEAQQVDAPKKKPTIAVIPCTNQKSATGGPAREVWTGAHFQLVLAHAEHFYDKVFIMSYKYGFISPETVIDPYDINIKNEPAAARLKWWYMLREQIHQLVKDEDPLLLALYTGNFERDRIIREFVKAGLREVITPWPHASTGQRMQLVYDGEPPFLLEDLEAGKYTLPEFVPRTSKTMAPGNRTPVVVDASAPIEWEE